MKRPRAERRNLLHGYSQRSASGILTRAFNAPYILDTTSDAACARAEEVLRRRRLEDDEMPF